MGRLFHVSMGAVCFSDGGASFLSGGDPTGGIGFGWWEGGFEKNRKMRDAPPLC